jgi:hypothetical protein
VISLKEKVEMNMKRALTLTVGQVVEEMRAEELSG